ncbi:MAG: RluA family pseudouridine synthase [Tissierellia bacterium]|nr:RluA family pseudouridine synthase [Tissierellia bacterium]
MKRLIVEENDGNQRVDRFLKKYFEKAPLSFLYKNLRKKNIKVNGKKADPKDILQPGDYIDLYLKDETIEKFRRDRRRKKSSRYPEILFENQHIILMKKKVGILSHNDKKAYEDNMVDRMVDYLIFKGEYNPRQEQTFRPGICNRLDRNTSGIIIGAKDADSLQLLNTMMRSRMINKYYLALVHGVVKEDFNLQLHLDKSRKNQMSVKEEGKQAITKFKVLARSKDYTLLSCDLITGRTHQIRVSLEHAGYPIVGDRKYGDPKINGFFQQKFGYDSQFLHNYSIAFEGEGTFLEELSHRQFYYPPEKREAIILDRLFPRHKGKWPW